MKFFKFSWKEKQCENVKNIQEDNVTVNVTEMCCDRVL